MEQSVVVSKVLMLHIFFFFFQILSHHIFRKQSQVMRWRGDCAQLPSGTTWGCRLQWPACQSVSELGPPLSPRVIYCCSCSVPHLCLCSLSPTLPVWTVQLTPPRNQIIHNLVSQLNSLSLPAILVKSENTPSVFISKCILLKCRFYPLSSAPFCSRALPPFFFVLNFETALSVVM